MNGTLGLIILLLVGLGVLWASVVLLTVRLLTRPPRRTYATAVSRGKAGDPGELPTPRPYRTWSLKACAGEFPVWDIEGFQAADPAAPVIVVAHGWGDSKLGVLSRLPAFDAAGRIVAIDLPGHGESSKRPRFTLGVREIDVVAALIDEIRTQDARPIVLYGWSLGAGLCIAAAARNPARIIGVVAESPYRKPQTPARNVMALYGLPHRFTLMAALRIVGLRSGIGWRWIGFDRAEHAVKLRASAPECPLLIVHGVNDDICPLEDGQRIAAAGHGQIAEIAGKGHNDLWSSEGTPVDRVRGFLEQVRTQMPH